MLLYTYNVQCRVNLVLDATALYFCCRTVIRFVSTSEKFGICTIVGLNGTLLEDQMRRFKGECAQFSFNKCPIYTHDGARANLVLTHKKRITVHCNPFRLN